MRSEIINETVSTYNKAANNYHNKFMDMDLYDDTFDKFCDLIDKKNAAIFEIATGPGNITKYLNAKRPDFKIYGIDMAPRMIELAKRNNPTVNFDVMNCQDIANIDNKFDGIMCGFCMPYLSKEEIQKLIKDTSNLLNETGIFYMSTMEGDYNKSGFETTSFSENDRVYIHYHQADYLEKCLKESGFEIVETIRKQYPEPDDTFLTDLILIARKNS